MEIYEIFRHLKFELENLSVRGATVTIVLN